MRLSAISGSLFLLFCFFLFLSAHLALERQRWRGEHTEDLCTEEEYFALVDQMQSERRRTGVEHEMWSQTMDFMAEFIASCGKWRTGKLNWSAVKRGERPEENFKTLALLEGFEKMPVI